MAVANRAKVARLRVPSVARPKVNNQWIYSYALFNAAATNVDSLIVVFAAVVIGATPSVVSQVDVMDTVGFVIAGAVFGRVADKLRHQRPLILASFLLGGLAAAAFAVANTTLMLIVLSLVFGFFMGAVNPSSSILVTRLHKRHLWAEQFGLFNRVLSLAGGFGLAFGILWLAVVGHVLDSEKAMRFLFPASGGIAFLAAITAVRWIVEPQTSQRQAPLVRPQEEAPVLRTRKTSLYEQAAEVLVKACFSIASFVVALPPRLGKIVMSIPVGLVELQRFFRDIPLSLGGVPSETSGLLPDLWEEYRDHQRARARESEAKDTFKDSLILYYVSTLVLFFGFGMATTVLPVFVTRELGAPGYIALTVTAVYLLSATLAYGALAKQVNRVMPLRMQTMSVFARGLIFVCLAALGALAIPGYVSVGLLIALIAFSGVAWAAITVTGVTRTALLAPTGRQGEAVGFYQAVSNGGMIIGALSGGATAQFAGFTVVFGAAAGLCLVALIMLLKL